MTASRKALDHLRARDFEQHPLWLVDLPKLDSATPAALSDDLEGDGPYVALTNYVLQDGTRFRGYCFIYDCTGHVLFDSDGEPIPLSTYASCTSDEASTVASALKRAVERIFPVDFRASVKVLGRLPEGRITVQASL